MQDMENVAKVYGDGDITIVVNTTTASARVFVGTQQIGYIQKLNLVMDCKEPNVQIEMNFPQSHNADTSLKIEEQVRSVKQQAPWVKITR